MRRTDALEEALLKIFWVIALAACWLISFPAGILADDLPGQIVALGEELGRRYAVLARALEGEAAIDSLRDPGKGLHFLLDRCPWERGGDDAELRLARQALEEATADLDEAELAVRGALSQGREEQARGLFTQRFLPACLEMLVLIDAAQRACAGPFPSGTLLE